MSTFKKMIAVIFSVFVFFLTIIGRPPRAIAVHTNSLKTQEPKVEEIEHEPSLKDVAGKKALIPSNFTAEEMDLFERLVSAEAKGESFEGKVAVAMVVLNRIDDPRFPNALKEVIYAKNQFQPVDNGAINEPATEEAKQAVKEAISQRGTGDKSVYFYNPDLVDHSWLETREVTKVIDHHLFAK